MPFTPAHVAAVLPLRRTRLPWSALVVGSMAPDLVYFLRLSPDDRFGHTLVGAFVLSLPLAIATLWIFHTIVKVPLVELLPSALGSRCSVAPFQFGGVVRFVKIAGAILVGLATHVAWDSFTHASGWFSRHWRVLQIQFAIASHGHIPVYKFLQHISTIVGLTAVGFALWTWFRETEPNNAHPFRKMHAARKAAIGGIICAVALLGAFVRAIMATAFPLHLSSVKTFSALFVVGAIAFAWWELVLYGIWRRITRYSPPA